MQKDFQYQDFLIPFNTFDFLLKCFYRTLTLIYIFLLIVFLILSHMPKDFRGNQLWRLEIYFLYPKWKYIMQNIIRFVFVFLIYSLCELSSKTIVCVNYQAKLNFPGETSILVTRYMKIQWPYSKGKQSGYIVCYIEFNC